MTKHFKGSLSFSLNLGSSQKEWMPEEAPIHLARVPGVEKEGVCERGPRAIPAPPGKGGAYTPAHRCHLLMGWQDGLRG